MPGPRTDFTGCRTSEKNIREDIRKKYGHFGRISEIIARGALTILSEIIARGTRTK